MHVDLKFPVTKRLTLALLASLVASAVMAAPPGASADGTMLGYSVANMDTRVSLRKDFYRHTAGQWLDRTETPASEAEVGGFTELSINLDRQLLERIQDSMAANGAPGSPRQQIVALRGASAQG